MQKILIVAASLLLAACSGESEPGSGASAPASIDPASVSLQPEPDTGRWFSEQQVAAGKETFTQYCAGCHGANAESTPNWKTLDDNGNYPPPPLNGSAHAWHHPLAVLKMVIEEGGEPVGGVMPAWGDTLTDEQIINVIASFQSYWPDKTYELWLEREKASRGDE